MNRRKTITIDGIKMLYSRYVMEQHLGRNLTDKELVHHINEDETDDRIENLQVVTKGEHNKIHFWQGGTKASRERCRERRRKDAKEYRRKNKEKIAKADKKRKQKNRERNLKRAKEYYQKNKDEIKTRRREARKRKKEENQ